MAGLVVGHDGPSGLQGVAPDARVLPIRVMGWQQTADGSWAVLGRGDLLAGLERAVDPDGDGDVEDAAAVALVGGVEPMRFASSPEARATAGATALGTLVVAPVGNDGRPGPGFGTMAAPAAAEAIAVGTLDARREVLEADAQLRVDDDTVLDGPVRVLGGAALKTASASRWRWPARRSRSPTAPMARWPRATLSATSSARTRVSLVAGKAVVVQADQGAVERRVRNAAEAGAAAVLVSGTNLPAGSLDVEDGVSVPVVAIPADAGQAALAGGATLDLRSRVRFRTRS